jgi:hypothetical protein
MMLAYVCGPGNILNQHPAMPFFFISAFCLSFRRCIVRPMHRQREIMTTWQIEYGVECSQEYDATYWMAVLDFNIPHI